MLNTEFAAAVLEGIEGTLEELIGRGDPSDFRDRLTALQDETAAVRRSLEETVGAERADGELAGFKARRFEYTGTRLESRSPGSVTITR